MIDLVHQKIKNMVMKKSAVIDNTKKYRYSLYREWEPNNPKVVFVMLNPSTADEQEDDPTLSYCIALGRDWGYGSLEVVNLFAYRSPKPEALEKEVDPVGSENNSYLEKAGKSAAEEPNRIIIAWGNHGTLNNRNQEVLDLFKHWNVMPVYCLGKTKKGHPYHPLYFKRSGAEPRCQIFLPENMNEAI